LHGLLAYSANQDADVAATAATAASSAYYLIDGCHFGEFRQEKHQASTTMQQSTYQILSNIMSITYFVYTESTLLSRIILSERLHKILLLSNSICQTDFLLSVR